mgnify:CR=1 FL=1
MPKRTNKTMYAQYEQELLDKTLSVNNFVKYGLDKLLSMFEYSGLPDSIPQRNLELILLQQGDCIIAKHNNTLYALAGSYGARCNAYYEAETFLVNNPWIKCDKEFTFDVDCVLIRNDSNSWGLLPLLYKYAVLMCENEISIRNVTINTRMQTIIAASDDSTRQSAIKFLQDLKDGKLSAIATPAFLQSLSVYNSSTTNTYITAHIELEQYLKASFFNEIGLNANYNMKREYIGKDENLLSDDILLPFCDDMLRNRKLAIDKVNSMFGTNISIDYSSTWKSNQTENEKEIALNESAGNEIDDSSRHLESEGKDE